MKKCIIAGAMPAEKFDIEIGEEDFVIAADAGLENLKKLGIKPDLIIGDWDSSGIIPEGDNVMSFPVKKDYTDSMLAINEALKRGFKEIWLFGCLGGRLDHSVANIQSLEYILDNGARGYIYENGQIMTVIGNSEIEFDEKQRGAFGIFSLSDKCEGVTIKGLEYEAENITLPRGSCLGCSNRFIGKKSKITVKKGTALLTYEKNGSAIF